MTKRAKTVRDAHHKLGIYDTSRWRRYQQLRLGRQRSGRIVALPDARPPKDFP